jgi:digeranylgeranylglycerophospholipid reductase
VILNFDEEGFILNRKIFDYELALSAVNSGAELFNHSYVYDLIIDNSGKVTGVKVEKEGAAFEIKSKIVIAADGVESRVGRFAGIETFTDYRHMESCYQVTADGFHNINHNTCYFYFGKECAPSGYLWVFPKGKDSANLGVGIGGAEGKKKSASKYLNDFIAKKYPDIKIKHGIAGGVPCTSTLKHIAAPGIMIAGDAARQVNPLSGGGITSGMIAGSIAGRIAAESVLINNPGHIFLYEKEWNQRLGKKHETYNRLKNGIYGFDDLKLNSIACSFNRLSPEERTLGKLFITALINKPSLLIDVAKVFII